MRRHALTDTAFARLGAGRPDPATLAELRRSQLGRHLLLLRQIVRAEPGSAGWWAARLRADPRLLTDPLFGAWAAHRLRRGSRAGTGPASAVAPGCAEQGQRCAPGCAEQDPPDAPRCAEQTLHETPRWGERDSGPTLTATHGDLSLQVRLVDRDPRRHLLGLRPTAPLTDAEVTAWQHRLDHAWRLLADRHRADAVILTSVLDCIVPVEPDPAARGISATSADAYGAVAMSAPPEDTPPTHSATPAGTAKDGTRAGTKNDTTDREEDGAALAAGLLHEVAHSVLNATQYLFDLHRRPAALTYSPWRDDPRPASGVLHGAYAYLAVTRFWRAEAAATGDRLAAFEFARWREAVAGAAEHLLSGDLTPAGIRFVTALRDEVRPWLAEPVDPDVTRLARAANTDHRLRWRLRNLTVDPAGAAAVAAAWRAGARPPPVESRLVPAPRRALENSARLDLVHGALRGRPRPGGRATAGDAAFVRGDYGTARRAYAEGVDWTGLALTVPIEGPLEVIASAYRLLGERPDPVAFAAWMTA